MDYETYQALKRIINQRGYHYFTVETGKKDYKKVEAWIDEVAKEYEDELPNEIKISWCIEDVKSLDDTLTEDQCKEVLQSALSDHDATIGINWDVLKFHIDQVKNS